MPSQVVVLVDDSKTNPFWTNESAWDDLPTDWTSPIKIEVDGFDMGDPVEAVKAKLPEAMREHPSEYQWFIVTDSRFGSNSHGGADLLQALRADVSGLHLAWDRAVVYSENPEVGDVDATPGEFRAVSKRGKSALEARRILRFLATGKYPELDPIRLLSEALLPLRFCCDTLRTSVATEPLRPMTAYGVPVGDPHGGNYVFDPMLLDQGDLPKPFGAATAECFAEIVKQEFMRYYRFGIAARSDGAEKSAEYAWQIVLQNLHPWNSLLASTTAGVLPAARMLWEIIQTGGKVELLSQHPSRHADMLAARERVWVRRQLDSSLSLQVRAAMDGGVTPLAMRLLKEFQELDDVMQVASAGEQCAKEPTL